MAFSIDKLTRLFGNNVALAILLGFLAFITRFYGIWEWNLVDDEFFTAQDAQNRYASLVNPAYYLLVVLIYDLLGHELWYSRLPALMLGVVSVPLFFLTWSKVFGKKVIFYAAIIIVFSAWHLWFSQLARFYIGVFLFSSLAYYFYYIALREDNFYSLIFAGLSTIVGIFFHATFVLVPLSVLIATIFFLAFRKKIEGFKTRMSLVIIFLAVLFFIVSFPVFNNILNNWLGLGQTWGVGSPAFNLVLKVAKYIQIPIVVSGVIGWAFLFRKDKVLALYFAICILVPLVALLIGSMFFSVRPDYVFYILPLVIILSGYFCKVTGGNEKKELFYSLGVLFLIVSLLIPAFVSHYTGKMSLHLNEPISFLKNNYDKNDKLLAFISGTNTYGGNSFSKLPYIGHERDNSIDWKSRLDSIVNPSGRVWVFLSIKRKPLARALEHWLLCNAQLVWRKTSRRFDYEVDGYQIFLVDPNHVKDKISACE